MSDNELILRALNGWVKDAVASVNPVLPIAFLGRNFSPPADGKYFELVWIPSNRNNDFWGDEKNYQGSMRIILHWPNDDAGAYEPLRLFDSVLSWFKKADTPGVVKLLSTPDVMQPLEQGSEILYPATLRYRYFKS